MATLITQVDRQTGNYEDVFIYTLNVRFNGLSEPIQSAEIKMLIPSYFTYYLGEVGKEVEEVREETTEEGTEVVFSFGSVEDMGLAVRIGMGLLFTQQAESGATFSLDPELWINGQLWESSKVEPITLVAVSRYTIARQLVLPTIAPAVGGSVYFQTVVENFGDLGSRVENARIVIESGEGVTLDPDYEIVGKDISVTNGFADQSQDGVKGEVEDGKVVFFLPAYRGEKYQFIYRGMLDEGLSIGDEIPSTATLTIGEQVEEDFHTIILGEEVRLGTASLYGPQYTLPNQPVGYEVRFSNSGNQILENVDLSLSLPEEIQYTQFRTGSFYFGEIEQDFDAQYTISYETTNGNSGTLGPYNTGVNSTVNLDTVVESGDNLSQLTWQLPTIGVGVENKISPHINGILKKDTTLDVSVLGSLKLVWDGGDTVANQSFVVENRSVLSPVFYSDRGNAPVRHGQTMRFTIGASGRQSFISNPILAMLLPVELAYVGNVTSSYTDYFTPEKPAVTPIPRVVENFDDTGLTLVKFAFVGEYGYDFLQKAEVRISFDVAVKEGARGSVVTSLLMNTADNVGIIPSGVSVYRDVNNIAEDTSVSTNYGESQSLTNKILFHVSAISGKQVKGMLDQEYGKSGTTLSGGEFSYEITLNNSGNADLRMVELVDILPYVGDTGVIETTTQRESGFPIALLGEVVAQVLPSGEEVEFVIAYSQSQNPVRFGGNFDVIGIDDDWNETPPEDLSSVTAFKITTTKGIIAPGDTLVLGIKGTVPVGTPIGEVAYNSVAVDVQYEDTNGVVKHLLATEADKVGISIGEDPVDTASIYGYVFFDDNGDGIASEDEPTVEDVGVVLYTGEGVPLSAVFTTKTYDGSGYQYRFANLPMGDYFLRFFIDDHLYRFTTAVLSAGKGSKVIAKTGITPTMSLTAQSPVAFVVAGILGKDQVTIHQLLKVNDSARGMMRNVLRNQMLIATKYEDTTELLGIRN